MQFNVAQLLMGPMGATRAFDIHEELRKPAVVGHVTLTRTDAGILAAVRCDTTGSWTCARCAAPFDQPVSLTIEEEFQPDRDLATGAPRQVEEDTYKVDAHHVLDLARAIVEYTEMERPFMPLCKEDCAGLCPVCGTNLNESSCTCTANAGHGAFAELERRWAQRSAR